MAVRDQGLATCSQPYKTLKLKDKCFFHVREVVMMSGRNRPDQEILNPDWLKTSHVT